MALMNWDEKYSVGITKIDEQHKKLINLINKLYDAMREGKGKEVLLSILDETLEYTKYHFVTEEGLFKQYSYSQIEDHIKEHRDMKGKVEQLYLDVQTGKTSISIEVFNFLKFWLNNHILNTDCKYKLELAGKIK